MSSVKVQGYPFINIKILVQYHSVCACVPYCWAKDVLDRKIRVAFVGQTAKTKERKQRDYIIPPFSSPFLYISVSMRLPRLVKQIGGCFRQFTKFIGPGFMVAVG